LAAFAALPTADPPAAADELERAVRQHGFVGAMINGHCQGRRLDDEFFWPILESAEALGVPIYLHPTPPPQQVVELLYAGNYSPSVTQALSNWGCGAHRNKHPHLFAAHSRVVPSIGSRRQFIVGHMGEVTLHVAEAGQHAADGADGSAARSADTCGTLHYTFSGSTGFGVP
jgi:predicted TIM-barrel fold metal-dependent hydrolase